MRNKITIKILSAVFAVLIFMGGFSVPAYAGGDNEGNVTNDSNVKTEEKKEKTKPLTPDGNMNLVDDVKGDAAKDKEFIIVKSKGGNYFYIVIDHAAQGENTVHFLNQVDEKDLLSIIDEKSNLTASPELPKQEQPKQETEKPKTEEKSEKKNPAGMIALSLILILGLAGGALYYFKILKQKRDVKGTTDLDELDFDDYEDDLTEEDSEGEEEISGKSEPDETL